MTTRERLAIMKEIERKNNEEWNKFKRQQCYCPHALPPAAEWALTCFITFFAVILSGIVAIIAA